MTKIHDRRIIADRKIKVSRRKRALMKEGALSLNLWQTMPEVRIGTIADDWKAVGADLSNATTQYAEDCG